MPLSENIIARLPKSAARVIATSIEEIVPTVDIDPKKARKIRRRVEEVIAKVATERDATPNGVVSHNAISGGLREVAEGETDPKIADALNGIAQSIACLTGQKDGAKFEPRAFRPMGEDIE